MDVPNVSPIGPEAEPRVPPELELAGSRAASRADSRHRGGSPPLGLTELLNNRFIIGGLGIVVILLLTAVVLTAIGQSDERDPGGQGAAAESSDETPSAPLGGLAGRTRATASYRNGPGTTFTILGTIPRGVTVAVVGRSEDNSWLQVRYPPNSSLRGWVDTNLLETEGNISALAIAEAGPQASVEGTAIPTIAIYEPVATLPPELPEPTDEPRPTARATRRATVTPYRTPDATPEATPDAEPTQTVVVQGR